MKRPDDPVERIMRRIDANGRRTGAIPRSTMKKWNTDRPPVFFMRVGQQLFIEACVDAGRKPNRDDLAKAANRMRHDARADEGLPAMPPAWVATIWWCLRLIHHRTTAVHLQPIDDDRVAVMMGVDAGAEPTINPDLN